MPSSRRLERSKNPYDSRADESKMQAFHAADWADRAEIAETFEDDRFRELARRLVFVNAPETLADGHRSQLQIWLQNRLHGREGVEAGRTLPVAIEELEKLAQERGAIGEIETIRTWLITAADTDL